MCLRDACISTRNHSIKTAARPVGLELICVVPTAFSRQDRALIEAMRESYSVIARVDAPTMRKRDFEKLSDGVEATTKSS